MLATGRQERFDTDDSGTHDLAALDSTIGSRLAGLRADGDPRTAVRVVADGGDPAEAILTWRPRRTRSCSSSG